MIWYFAYGSNLNHNRFRERVGEWSAHRRATLEGYTLRFSGEVESEGGGGAIIQPLDGGKVYGGAYAVSHDQIATMDDVELRSSMNAAGRGKRSTVRLTSDAGPLGAELYEVPEPKSYRAPSAAYLNLIVEGLRDFEYDDETIAGVEAAAAAEPVADLRATLHDD